MPGDGVPVIWPMLLGLKRAMLEQLPYGLALEGLAAADYWPSSFPGENFAQR